MTHSTCCKAEVIHEGDTIYCSKCKEYLMALTPPPVPCEIDGEIEKILDNRFYGFGGSLKERVWDYRGAIDDLTALFTHHTSVQVKEIKQLPEEAERELYDEWWCPWYECPNCKESNITTDFKYCPECGVKIKWLPAQAAEGEGKI